MDGCAVGELLQIVGNDHIADGRGNAEASQHNDGVAAVEHSQHVGHGGAIHAADANLFAAVFGLEKHQPEHAQKRDDDGDNRQHTCQFRESPVLVVQLFQIAVEQMHVDVLGGEFLVEVHNGPFNVFENLFDVGALGCAHQQSGARPPFVLVAPNIEAVRADGLAHWPGIEIFADTDNLGFFLCVA